MTEIIPAINAESFEEIVQKIKLIEPYAKWVHLDVADGTFTKNSIWHNASDLSGLQTTLNIGVHLMIGNIEKRIENWFLPNVKRIIFHLEVAHDPNFVINKIHEAGKEAGISINPETSWTQLQPYFKKADLFQLLSVHPGFAGQKFDYEVLHKIEEVHKYCPECIIESDGGMNLETAPLAVKAGANIIVAASAIFKGGNMEENIKQLRNTIS